MSWRTCAGGCRKTLPPLGELQRRKRGQSIMDPATLERLLIDRRLGELPPDAAALLDAYLQLEAGGRALAEEVDKTIAAAERVSRDEHPARDWPMPPLAGTRPVLRPARRRPGQPATVWIRRVA